MFIWYIKRRFKNYLNLYLINSHTYTHTCMNTHTQLFLFIKENQMTIDNYIHEDTNTVNLPVMIFEEFKYISVKKMKKTYLETDEIKYEIWNW